MSEEERLTILEWLETLKKNNKLRRLWNRRGDYQLYMDDSTVPIAVWKIKKRIIEKEGLHEYRQDPQFGDILTLIPNGSFLHPHTDVSSLDGSVHCRFNVFLNVPDVFDTYYGGYLVEAKNRHYAMCRSGLDLHWTSENITDDRVTLSFGYMLPMEKMNKLYVIPDSVVVSSIIGRPLYDLLIDNFISFMRGV
jgi:hypothetical protein